MYLEVVIQKIDEYIVQAVNVFNRNETVLKCININIRYGILTRDLS